jgi:hypothetical protein
MARCRDSLWRRALNPVKSMMAVRQTLSWAGAKQLTFKSAQVIAQAKSKFGNGSSLAGIGEMGVEFAFRRCQVGRGAGRAGVAGRSEGRRRPG